MVRALKSVAVAVVAGLLAGALVHGQPKKWTARTADGQPDLQGYWTNATVTPLRRPAEFAGKEFTTAAEAAAYEKKIAEKKQPA